MNDAGYRPAREDAWIETVSGIAFFPFRPTAAMVSIEDIAHALSSTCRWNGHTTQFYSVAEHSILMSDYLRGRGHSKETCLTALLHDAAEAYVSDVPGPIKPHFPGFKEMEEGIDRAVAKKFGSNYPFDPVVKELDRAMIGTEHDQLFGEAFRQDFANMPRVDIQVRCWHECRAYDHFMGRYQSLRR